MTKVLAGNGKPHAVCIPLPYQSHIKSMLKLAKLLHHKGFHITFVNTEFNHRRLLQSRGPDSMEGFPDFQFETIPDGLSHPEDDTNTFPDIVELTKSTLTNWSAPFCDLVHKLNNSSSSKSPGPVTCIVADGFLPFAVKAAKQLQVPVALFFTISACALVGFQQIPVLKERGVIPLKDKNSCLDAIVDGIPGMKDIRFRDLPVYYGGTDSNDNLAFALFGETFAAASDAPAIILHTFDALEQQLLDVISPLFHSVFAIGPLQLLIDRIKGDKDKLSSIGCNLWKEESECLRWLDSKKQNSVVYVNFGSLTKITKEQLIEFGMGLAKAGHPFLWIIRSDLVSGDASVLPPEFVEEAGEKGFIASWCPQEEVLNHPSIGGFLTHCGWGSTIESISSGVPLLCWPFLGDQPMNCRYSCREWGIGMEIDREVDRNNIEKLVRELMEGEEGKKLKSKVMEWKKLAEEATSPDGSSSINLDKLMDERCKNLLHLKQTQSTTKTAASFGTHHERDLGHGGVDEARGGRCLAGELSHRGEAKVGRAESSLVPPWKRKSLKRKLMEEGRRREEEVW
ncbi:hypothetical protein Tsubulata_045221 [Turnera subulata]|uniref:Glycosyltransferase n=1 Tax=Turnera subulata TaxID=218843 RepID=A0A9Q0FDL4_9ROSI|nr:hypothetical protein Tsubulata_045221 [Turnera subulata]